MTTDFGIEVPEAGRMEDLQDGMVEAQAPDEAEAPDLPELDESQDAELDPQPSKQDLALSVQGDASREEGPV